MRWERDSPGPCFSGASIRSNKESLALIWLTRTDGDQFMLNDDQILWIDAQNDTIVVLHSGDRVRVLESGDEIKERIVNWRRKLLGLSFLSADEIDSGE